jgi:hypothetical protein
VSTPSPSGFFLATSLWTSRGVSWVGNAAQFPPHSPPPHHAEEKPDRVVIQRARPDADVQGPWPVPPLPAHRYPGLSTLLYRKTSALYT